jgi:excisionase family DNA binding protein
VARTSNVVAPDDSSARIAFGLLHAFQIVSGAEPALPDDAARPERSADVMTADEVAALLRLDRKTVYDYAARGEIPCRRIGKRMLFSRDALALWLGSCSERSSKGNSK